MGGSVTYPSLMGSEMVTHYCLEILEIGKFKTPGVYIRCRPGELLKYKSDWGARRAVLFDSSDTTGELSMVTCQDCLRAGARAKADIQTGVVYIEQRMGWTPPTWDVWYREPISYDMFMESFRIDEDDLLCRDPKAWFERCIGRRAEGMKRRVGNPGAQVCWLTPNPY